MRFFAAAAAVVSMLTVFAPVTHAQICPSPNYVFNNQTEIDAFPATCDVVSGQVIIDEALDLITPDPIVDLTPLGNLTSVGDLAVRDASVLTALTGLDSIATIGGFLQVRFNDALTNLDALSTVGSIGGNVVIRDNPLLNSIAGLSGVGDIPGYVILRNNDSLTSLGGLEGVSSVGSYLDILLNDQLADVNALSSLTSIGGNLSIVNNAGLANLDGLSSLISVGGDLGLLLNGALDSCTAIVPLLDTIDDALPGPGVAPTPDVAGAVNISTNGGVTCDSQAGILDAGGVLPGPTQAIPVNQPLMLLFLALALLLLAQRARVVS